MGAVADVSVFGCYLFGSVCAYRLRKYNYFLETSKIILLFFFPFSIFFIHLSWVN